MDKFNIGDEVYHRVMKRKGVVNDLISEAIIEVTYNNDTYYWTREHVDNLELTSCFDDWDRHHKSVPDKIGKCVCLSRDLFHYGCRCGQFAKEKNEVQG